MIRQYIYSASDAGLQQWPSGTLRLEGIEVTTNPQYADLFVCPGNLSLFQDGGTLNHSRLYKLPYLKGNEARNVFFDVSDNFTKALGLPIIFLRCDARDWMLKDDPNTIQMAWPVEDYEGCVELPAGGFKFDVSFQGWLSTDTRIDSSRSCSKNPNLKCDIAEYTDFTGYIYHTPEGVRRRAEFRRSMRESRVALCPESIPGVLPYRFFEAMSAGRVPALVSSDYVLPYADKIPYDDFIIRIERDEAYAAGGIIRNWISGTPDGELVEMGCRARKNWEVFLDSRKWPELMGVAVRQKVEATACV